MRIDPGAWPAWVLFPFVALYLVCFVMLLWCTLKLSLRSFRAVMSDRSRDPVLFFGYVHGPAMRRAAWADADMRRFLLALSGIAILSSLGSLI